MCLGVCFPGLFPAWCLQWVASLATFGEISASVSHTRNPVFSRLSLRLWEHVSDPLLEPRGSLGSAPLSSLAQPALSLSSGLCACLRFFPRSVPSFCLAHPQSCLLWLLCFSFLKFPFGSLYLLFLCWVFLYCFTCFSYIHNFLIHFSSTQKFLVLSLMSDVQLKPEHFCVML